MYVMEGEEPHLSEVSKTTRKRRIYTVSIPVANDEEHDYRGTKCVHYYSRDGVLSLQLRYGDTLSTRWTGIETRPVASQTHS